ncbi:MAG: hypothetical protein ACE5MI_13430 [Acidimicrobiia bacterium]
MSWRSLVGWFVIGVIVAVALQVIQMRSLGGDNTALLAVGSDSLLRPMITAELGEVHLVEGFGHDGQMSYLVARDPWRELGLSLDHAGYRYRRILFPLLAGGFGLLGPRATVWGLQLWAVVGLGLAAAGLAGLAVVLRLPTWVVAGVLANPGVWLSVQLLTPDVLALGLTLTGLLLCLKNRWLAGAAALAAAALTKDQYLVSALGLAGWLWWSVRDRKRAVIVAAVPAGLLGAWSWSLGPVEGMSVRGTLTLPGVGLLSSIGVWARDGARGVVFGLLAAVGLVYGAVNAVLARGSLYAWLTLPWIGLGLLSSTWVWDHGNNALRVFAPVWVFGTLSLGVFSASRARIRSST